MKVLRDVFIVLILLGQSGLSRFTCLIIGGWEECSQRVELRASIVAQKIFINRLCNSRIATGKSPGIKKMEPPKDWKLIGDPAGFRDADGVTYFTVRTPADAKQEKHKVLLHSKGRDPLEASIEVVRKYDD